MASYNMLPNKLLLHLFKNVDINDLINLSDVDGRSRQIVRADLRVDFDLYTNIMLKNINFKKCFIKSFPYCIENCTENQVYTIFCYISRFCWNFEYFYIDELKYSPGRALKRVLKSVVRLRLYNCLIFKKYSNINKWFPNLVELYLNGNTEIQQFSALENNFKFLKCVNITGYLNDFDFRYFEKLNPKAYILWF